MFHYYMTKSFKNFANYCDLSEKEIITHCDKILEHIGYANDGWRIKFDHRFYKRYNDCFNGCANNLGGLLDESKLYAITAWSNHFRAPLGLWKSGMKFPKESLIFMLAHEIGHFKQYREQRLLSLPKLCFYESQMYKTEGPTESMETYMRLPWEYECNKMAYDYCASFFDVDFTKNLFGLSEEFINIKDILDKGPESFYEVVKPEDVSAVIRSIFQ